MNEHIYDLRLAANDRVYPGLSQETLRRWVVERRVLGHDWVKLSASTDWNRVSAVTEFAALLPVDTHPHATPVRPATPPPQQQSVTIPPAKPIASPKRPESRRPESPQPLPDGGPAITVIGSDLGIVEPTHRRPRRMRRQLEDTVMDMTPMIDVTFQLLIFFMFANQMANPTPIEAPEAIYGKGILPDGTQALLIDDQGRYYVGENAKPENITPLNELLIEVQKNAELAPQPLEVIITAHKKAKHLHVRQLVEEIEKLDRIGPVHLGVEEKR